MSKLRKIREEVNQVLIIFFHICSLQYRTFQKLKSVSQKYFILCIIPSQQGTIYISSNKHFFPPKGSHRSKNNGILWNNFIKRWPPPPYCIYEILIQISPLILGYLLFLNKGSLSLPLSMNFWKSSKRPLTPPLPPFFGKNVAIFCYEIFWNGNDPPKLASQMLKILQRNFLDRKWPPLPPLELFQKFIDNGRDGLPLGL